MQQWASRAEEGQYVLFLDKVQAKDFVPQDRARGIVYMIRMDIYHTRFNATIVNAALAVAPRHLPTFDSEGTFVDEDKLNYAILSQLVMSNP